MTADDELIYLAQRESRTPSGVRTVTLLGHLDDVVATVALAASGLFEDYISYQRPGARWFAGNAHAAVVMTRHRLMTHATGSRTQDLPLAARPLRQLGQAIRRILRPGQRAFGYLTFEVAHLATGSAARHSQGPLAHFVVPQVEIRWTATGTRITSGNPTLLDAVVDIVRSAAPPPSPPTLPVELSTAGQRHRYEQAVADIVAAIDEGKLRKAIISRRIDVPFAVDLARSYEVGLRQNTPARSFLLQVGERRCAGFSPETLAEVGATGEVLTQPLAGTRPLLHNAAQDLRLREELEWDVKECYEHIISVRHAADELRTVCTPASVMIRDLLTVKERGTVQHLGSTVTGQLRPGNNAWDALEALFPAVTASGISKQQALHAIAVTEQDQRELYAGAICMVDASGALDSAVVLRSIFQQAQGTTWLRAGAGIVADSHPSREYDETTNKLRSVADCLVQENKSHHPAAMARRVPGSNPTANTCQSQPRKEQNATPPHQQQT
jgi:salicylate synthetase